MNFSLSILITFAVTAFLGTCLNLLALRSWRRMHAAHWTERARALWPVRVFISQQLIFIPIAIYLGHTIGLENDSPLTWAPRALAALAGSILAAYPVDRQLFPFASFQQWLREIGAGWTLRLVYILILALGILLMPKQFGREAALVAISVAIFFTAWNLGLGLWLARRLGIIVPADDRLQSLFQQVAAKFGVLPPASAILRGMSVNAFALPLRRMILVSERLLREFNDAEVTSILAHEMGHLGESRWAIAGRFVLAYSLLPLVFIRPAMTLNPGLGLALVAGAILLISRLGRALGRRMEVRADALAHANSDAMVYASALERMYELNHVPAVMPGKQVHPHLYDRLVAAGLQPAYSRPAPPARYGWVNFLFGVMLAIGLLASMRHFPPSEDSQTSTGEIRYSGDDGSEE